MAAELSLKNKATLNMPETPEKEKLSLWPEVLFATIQCVYNAKKDIGNLSIMAIGVVYLRIFSAAALSRMWSGLSGLRSLP